MPVIFGWIVVLIVEGRVAWRPVHHTGRLSVHHVAHRRVRTVSTAWTCGQCREHYTLLRLELCSALGKAAMVELVTTPRRGSPTFLCPIILRHRVTSSVFVICVFSIHFSINSLLKRRCLKYYLRLAALL
jgi:hypothetical protein